MKNTMLDLNNHLFEQMERLNDEDLSQADLSKEIDRSKAMTNVAKEIIANGRLVLDAQEAAKGVGGKQPMPSFLSGERKALA